jgi:molybdenum cofactor cytidylyltransferase
MGAPKAALRLPDGSTFVSRIAGALTEGGAAPVMIVVSANEDAGPARAACGLPQTVGYIVNPDPDRGQLSSLQCGLTLMSNAPAVLVTLVDVPLVTAAVVRTLIDTWTSSGAPLVRLARAGRHGHPMLIAQPLIGDLLEADASSTARAIVRRYAPSGVELEMQEEGPFFDVDTPEEYARLLAYLTPAGREGDR